LIISRALRQRATRNIDMAIETLPIAKNQAHNKHDKDTPKGGIAHSNLGLLFPVLTSGGE
jgi:hypothetical protein